MTIIATFFFLYSQQTDALETDQNKPAFYIMTLAALKSL